jgi:hypothetical protein
LPAYPAAANHRAGCERGQGGGKLRRIFASLHKPHAPFPDQSHQVGDGILAFVAAFQVAENDVAVKFNSGKQGQEQIVERRG